MIAYSSYYDKSKQKVYENYEDAMKEAAMTYIIDTGDMPTSTTKLKLPLKFLVGDDTYNGRVADPPYLDKFKSPRGKSDTCPSSYIEVSLKPKQTTDDGKVDYNKSFNFKICLICQEYKSSGC